MFGISYYLIDLGLIFLSIAVVAYILNCFLSYRPRVESVKNAADVLNSEVRSGFLGISKSVKGIYLTRPVQFRVFVDPRYSYNWSAKITPKVIGKEVSYYSKPTKNTSLSGNAIFYRKNAVGYFSWDLSSAKGLEKKEVLEVLQELTQAAEIVEKSASKAA